MNMSLAFRQFLTMLATFFAAGESIAKTVHNLATVAEETSGQYVDEARADRQAKIVAREQAALAISNAQAGVVTDVTAKTPTANKAKATA